MGGRHWSGPGVTYSGQRCSTQHQSSGAVCKSRWPSWAPAPNKPTVSVDVIKATHNQPMYSREHGGTRAGQGGKTKVLDKEERLKTEVDREEKRKSWTRRKE